MTEKRKTSVDYSLGGLVHSTVDASVGFLAISNRTAPRKFKAANVSNATV